MGKRDDGSDGRTKDQSENGALYKSIKQAMDTRHPVGVVVGRLSCVCYMSSNFNLVLGKEYPFMPVRMDKEFSVLGWFQVTHIWPEREIDTGFIYYAYRLEYIGQEPKWWLAQPITPQDASPNPDFLCSECGKTSPQVFSNGPTCLTRECTRFYVFESENPVGEPRYSEKFLAGGKVHVDGMVDPGPIFPPIPARIEGKIGAACPVCRCASRRRHFTLLECEACGWTLGVDLPAYTIERLALDEANFAKSKHEATHERVAMRTLSIPGWNVTEWLFKDSSGAIVGSVSHFVATSQSGKEDANSLLAEIQATPLDLRRNAVRNPGSKYILRHRRQISA